MGLLETETAKTELCFPNGSNRYKLENLPLSSLDCPTLYSNRSAVR